MIRTHHMTSQFRISRSLLSHACIFSFFAGSQKMFLAFENGVLRPVVRRLDSAIHALDLDQVRLSRVG